MGERTHPQPLVRKGFSGACFQPPAPDVQMEGAAETRLGVGEEPGEGAGAGHHGPMGGACIWPARLGSPHTLILLSARPGAGLGNVTFQRKLFPFSPQEGKRQKDKQTPGVMYWETGQHMGLRQAPLLPLLQPPLQTPRSDSSRLAEFILAKDKWISQFIKGGRRVSLTHQP